MMLANSSVTAAVRVPSTSRVRSAGVVPRRSLRVRAEEKSFADQVDEAAQGLVEETKKNSGLDEAKLGQQPGNRPAATGEASEALSFAGLLPETINGRAAMVAMLAAFGAEVGSRQPVFDQIKSAPVLIGIAFATVIIGSIVPVVRKADLNQQGAGPFTQQAEIWNGRTAMVAFALLLTVETWKAGPGLVP